MMAPDSGSHQQPGNASVINSGDAIHCQTELPDTRISRWLDNQLRMIDKFASGLWIVVTAIIVWTVISRYVFNWGSVLLEELQWHIAGTAWLLGLAYTLVVDGHVRVDVLHERFSLKLQAWIELIGLLVLLLPFLGLAIYEMVPYAISSYQVGESSPAPAGLGNRWILKAILALSFMLITAAALSRLSRVTALLFGFPRSVKVVAKNIQPKTKGSTDQNDLEGTV